MNNNKIRKTRKERCYLCDSKGNNLYKGIKDRLFGVKGIWNIDKCSNSDCGLLWLNPMPITEDLPKLYESYYTHTHDPLPKKANWLVQVFRDGCTEYLKKKYQYPCKNSLLNKLISLIIRLNPIWTANLDFSVFYLPAATNGKLLEIGCGSGGMLKNMQDKGWNVTGVDFDKKSVSVAQGLGLNVYEGDVCELNLKEGSFDAIVMSHVIEHLPDPAVTIKKCLTLLRPDGKLVLITPNASGYNHNKFKMNSRILEPPRHLHIFNKNTLKDIVYKEKFKKIKVFSTVRDFSRLWWASENIELHGKFQMVRNVIPRGNKLMVSIRSLIYGYLIKLGHFEGDEIVVIANKSDK